ncbi:MAG: type II toxin-antitoxin system RelE/ParE family toxin [Burkholderiales bacterium]
MRYEVLLTQDGQNDLEELHEYIAEHDSRERAEHVLDRIEAALADLAAFPARGPHPKELLALGIREFRQTYFKPYRIVYRVDRSRVFVYLIADGRRDLQTLLARRMLGAG